MGSDLSRERERTSGSNGSGESEVSLARNKINATAQAGAPIRATCILLLFALYLVHNHTVLIASPFLNTMRKSKHR